MEIFRLFTVDVSTKYYPFNSKEHKSIGITICNWKQDKHWGFTYDLADVYLNGDVQLVIKFRNNRVTYAIDVS